MERTLYVVIMAGGTGTRFWPASRRARPKQFLPIAGPTPMLAATWARVAPLVPPERALVVAGSEHATLVRELLPDLPPANLLLEPVGRNTLACVALAAAEVRRRDPEAVQLVLPSDHVVAPEGAFREALSVAARTATDRSLVTLGVRPTAPATGYGYIELGEELERLDGHVIHSVARFVEKPERALAEAFLASGRFLWNSGVFVWTCQAIEAALQEHAPDVWAALRDARPGDLPPVYAGLPSVPVDVGVMEKASDRRVLPVDFTWSDVGSWDALAQVLEPDAAGNVLSGGAALEALDAGGNVVHGEPGTLVALIGVQDLVVVRVGSATLVCRRDRAEDVKALVERLAERPPGHI